MKSKTFCIDDILTFNLPNFLVPKIEGGLFHLRNSVGLPAMFNLFVIDLELDTILSTLLHTCVHKYTNIH